MLGTTVHKYVASDLCTPGQVYTFLSFLRIISCVHYVILYVLVKLLLQAGCVHFTSVPSPQTCDIKVLILLYTSEKRAYLGFIPNDQAAFVDRLRKVIQHQKTTQALIRQQGGQVSNLCLAKGQAFTVFVM